MSYVDFQKTKQPILIYFYRLSNKVRFTDKFALFIVRGFRKRKIYCAFFLALDFMFPHEQYVFFFWKHCIS